MPKDNLKSISESIEKLTFKEKGFVKDYAKTGNGVKAALKNYDTEDYSTAGNIASENLKKPRIQNALKSIGDSFKPEDILKKHNQLLNSTFLDHMTFPPFNMGKGKKDKDAENPGLKEKGEQLTDEEIIDLLATVNCKVQRIVHGDLVRHVYFWVADNTTQDKALDKIYKLKGEYAAEKKDITSGGEPIKPTVVFIPKSYDSNE